VIPSSLNPAVVTSSSAIVGKIAAMVASSLGALYSGWSRRSGWNDPAWLFR
jgi:hypothetical protein